jgi:hypothetical protein
MTRILNLTQHSPTPEQIAAGVVSGEISDAQQTEVRALLTFDTLPTPVEVRHRAERLAEIAASAFTIVDYGGDSGLCANELFKYAMIGGAPYLMAPLEVALRARGITPVYAFSVRESVDQVQPDGSVRKVAVFRHAGFVGCEIDEPETIEVMPANKEAELYLFVATECNEEWKKLHATTAESVTALFEKMKASDDGYNLELSADRKVGSWSAEGYLSIGKTAEIKAVQYFGVVYQF